MNRVVCASIIAMPERAIDAMNEHNILSLRELMAWRDRGFLTLEDFNEEILKDLQDVCGEIDKFNDKLKERIIPNKTDCVDVERKENDNQREVDLAPNAFRSGELVSDGRRRAREAILRDLDSILNLETPTSLRKAILKLMIDHPDKEFDRKTIKKLLERKYKGMISLNSDAIRSTLSSLESHAFIERTNNSSCYKITKYALGDFSKRTSAGNYFEESKKIESLKEAELSDFIQNNIGQEVEIRYKSERARSDKWWRRVGVHDQDDKYLYTTDCYPSGGRIRYLKERIVEYRAINV
jgi:Fe2+ or Zn2+ uptake regulation protein